MYPLLECDLCIKCKTRKYAKKKIKHNTPDSANLTNIQYKVLMLKWRLLNCGVLPQPGM